MKARIMILILFLLLPGFALANKNRDFFNVYDLEIEGNFIYHPADDLNNDHKPDVIMIHKTKEKKRMISVFFQHDDGFHKKADQTWEFDDRVILFDIGDDYNGDGRTDILTGKSNKELDIFFGRSDGLFARRKPDVKFEINLPPNGSQIKPVKLNNDNKMDLLIDYSDRTVEKDVDKSQLKILITKS